MSDGRVRRSVFDRLGDGPMDGMNRNAADTNNVDSKGQPLLRRESLSQREKQPASSSRKRPHQELEDGEIDDYHPWEGVTVPKRPSERFVQTSFGDNWTSHEGRKTRRRERTDSQQEGSHYRFDQRETSSYPRGDGGKPEPVCHWKVVYSSVSSEHFEGSGRPGCSSWKDERGGKIKSDASWKTVNDVAGIGMHDRCVENKGHIFAFATQTSGLSSRSNKREDATIINRKQGNTQRRRKRRASKQANSVKRHKEGRMSYTCPSDSRHVTDTSPLRSRAQYRDTTRSPARAAPQKINRHESPGVGRGSRNERRDSRTESKSEEIKEQMARDLRKLASLETGRDIAVWLSTRPDCLKMIVGRNEMSENEMETFVRVLAKACMESTHFQDNLKLVLSAVEGSTFFTKCLPEWIMKVNFSSKSEIIVNDICTLCSAISQQFPGQAIYVALITGSLYSNFHSHSMESKDITSKDGKILGRIRELSNDCRVTHFETQNAQKHRAAKQFRIISIIPELDEIRIDVKPHLKPNLKHGAYENVDAYLDTQFRLLREDFVAPLRNGICLFVKQQQTGSSGKRVDDVRVYHGIHILNPVCGHDGVSYRVQFSLRGWSQRRLASGKLLVYGSLVCLSCDGFRNVLFGVVSNRDQLREGIVDIQLQEPVNHHDIYKNEYIMVESEAFFEAYRHVLKGLQQITEQTFPLQKYIIKTSHEISAPAYLLDVPDAKYDLLSLLQPERAVQALEKWCRKKSNTTGTSRTDVLGICNIKSKHPSCTQRFLSHTQPSPHSPRSPSYLSSPPSYSPTSPSYTPTPPSYCPTSPPHLPKYASDGSSSPVYSAASSSVSPTPPLQNPPSPPCTKPSPSLSQALPCHPSTSPSSTSSSSPPYTPDQTEENVIGARVQDTSLSDPRRTPLLNFANWPDESAVCLDESQLKAVYMALTQELAIIQGPPGTGKTYVGLKIMEVLLNKHNCEIRAGEIEEEPILVVCYTNHALDQFLEGVLKFEKNVVRIGSRSKSETLEKYNLKNVMFERSMSGRTGRRRRSGRQKLALYRGRDDVKHLIESIVQNASAFNKVIVGVEELRSVMMPRHSRSICDRATNDAGIMSKWLDLEHFMANFSGNDPLQEEINQHLSNVEALMESEITNDRRLDDEVDSRYAFTGNSSAKMEECQTEEFSLAELKRLAEKKDDSNKQRLLKALKFIEKQMKSSERMNKDEALGVNNVWNLSFEDRWRLYRYWVDAYRSQCLATTTEHINEYNRYTRAIKEIENDEVCKILRDVKVIGMTTTGAAKWQSVLQRVGPRIVVVEEAAEVMEAHVIATLSQHCQHLILIGDHQQLKPNPAVYHLAKKYNLDISLFERMINNGFPRQTLARQHRMRPQIAEIMRNHFYKDLQDDDSVLHMKDVRGVSKNMFFISHGYREDSNDDGMKSHSSKHEADMVVALCKYLLQQGYSPSQVTILTVYTGQLLSIKSQLSYECIKGVRFSVVDNYQGEECDIVLLSLVRSNDEEKIGFLRIHNRICVMLSRARLGLYCIGNFSQLTAKSEKWKSITDEMKTKQLLGSSLALACPVHPDVKTEVACASDFKMVPNGGCRRPCEFRLPCGHVCPRLCHPDDRSHSNFKCPKPCEKKICEANHRCPKPCGEQCPKACDHRVKKQLPGCGHSASMKCYNNPAFIDCVEKCDKKLSCGHTCRSLCSKPCGDRPCAEKVLRTDLPCGHKEQMPCSASADECPALCGQLLACGHKCPGKCSSCLGGRLHVSCKQKCGRVLVCGHRCRHPCASNCPPCEAECESRCLHSRCQRRCWEPCTSCQEPCMWGCSHFSCGKKCSEPCDRPPCDKPCQIVLKCGHQCIGMCGEPCPCKCRECDKQEVTEIFFGNEDEDNARFVELQDCGHVVEVTGLDRWMKQVEDPSPAPLEGQETSEDEQSTVAIQLKACPICKTPIRRSTRYGGLINKMLADVERVKGQVIANPHVIALRKGEIRLMLKTVKESNFFAKASFTTATKLLDPETKSLFAINILLNETNCAHKVVKLEKSLTHEAESSTWYHQTMSQIGKVASRLFNPSRPFRGTEQELLDFPNELHRLHLCCEACDISGRPGLLQNNEKDLQDMVDRVGKLLYSCKPLTAESEKESTELLKKLRERVGGLSISKETKVMIIKAMGLSKGHWYKCPNGHVYAIGECGGAMQRAKCPECKADIGGAQHRLASGNAVASEMDGAQYPAWSEQANLANYDLQNI